MLSFKNFIAEEKEKSSTTKIFIDHLDKMKPLKFLELAKKLSDEFGGILSKEHIEITEKIDGSALRIGQDENGNAFIESSTSPSTYNPGEFTARAIAKGYSDSIGKHFDEILKNVKNDKTIQSVLSKFNDGKGIKIIGEILYLPLGIDEVDKIKFIRISYDKNKLGTEWTFIPFNVVYMDGTSHEKEEQVKQALYKISSEQRKYLKPTIKIPKDIDISIELKNVDGITKKYANIETVLASRKKIDADLKEVIKNEIAEFQRLLAKKILQHVETGVFGKDFEGIVLKLSDGSLLKIVTDNFKNTEYKTR